ncbi:MAG: hypothetical protein WBE37_25960 [Bryobacteraceae bacterium]
MAISGAVYREVRAACRTTVDLGIKTGSATTLAGNFIAIARERFARQPAASARRRARSK